MHTYTHSHDLLRELAKHMLADLLKSLFLKQSVSTNNDLLNNNFTRNFKTTQKIVPSRSHPIRRFDDLEDVNILFVRQSFGKLNLGKSVSRKAARLHDKLKIAKAGRAEGMVVMVYRCRSACDRSSINRERNR